MAQLYLDLDELDRVFDRRWLWSVDRPNLAQFRRRDYFGALFPLHPSGIIPAGPELATLVGAPPAAAS